MKYWYTFFVIVLVNSMALLSAQEKGGVKGEIRDSDTLVAFSAIVLQSVPDSAMVVGMTAIDGRFEIPHVASGDYRLQVSCMGYKDKSVPVQIKGEMVDVGIILLEQDAVALKSVTVRGKRQIFRQENGQIIVNVSGTTLAESGSIEDLLKKSPGVMVNKDGDISIVGKGKPIIYVNEQEIQSTEMLSSIQASDVDRIEIERNVSSQYSADGQAVLRIRTKRSVADKLGLMVFDHVQFGRKIGNTVGFQIDHKNGGWSNLLSYSFRNAPIQQPSWGKSI